MNKLIDTFVNLLEPVIAVLAGLFIGLLFVTISGLHVGEGSFFVQFGENLVYLYRGSVGSNLDGTLIETVPLIFAGLSVAFAFHAGLFNIGAQGQLLLGCLLATIVGIYFPFPLGSLGIVGGFLAFLVAVFFAFLGGALWGFVPGFLRAKFGCHEVISTIMMNYIAYSVVQWVILLQVDGVGFIKDTSTLNSETIAVQKPFVLSNIGHLFSSEAQLSTAIIFALCLCFFLWFVLYYTKFGFQVRAVGQNEHAAREAGFSGSRIRMISMAIAGGLAGLVALSVVFGTAGMGHEGKLREGVPEYGFMAIAVALLARCNPIAVIPAAILFAGLQKGCMELQFEREHVTQEVAFMLQALVILAVSADGLWAFFRTQVKTKVFHIKELQG